MNLILPQVLLISSVSLSVSDFTKPAPIRRQDSYGAPSAPTYQDSYTAPSYSAPSYQAPSYSAPSYQSPSYSAPSYNTVQSVEVKRVYPSFPDKIYMETSSVAAQWLLQARDSPLLPRGPAPCVPGPGARHPEARDSARASECPGQLCPRTRAYTGSGAPQHRGAGPIRWILS